MQYNYQNFQPTPPPPKNNRWKIWLILALVVASLIGLLIYGAFRIGKKIGSKIGDAADVVKNMADSINNFKSDSDYKRAYEEFAGDTIYVDVIRQLDSLKNRTNELCSDIAHLRETFEDTLKKEHASFINIQISKKFFQEKNRAIGLKNEIIKYRDELLRIAELDASNSDYARGYLDVEGVSNVNGFGPKQTWEERNFTGPPEAVILNLNTIRLSVRSFESVVLLQIEENGLELAQPKH